MSQQFQNIYNKPTLPQSAPAQLKTQKKPSLSILLVAILLLVSLSSGLIGVFIGVGMQDAFGSKVDANSTSGELPRWPDPRHQEELITPVDLALTPGDVFITANRGVVAVRVEGSQGSGAGSGFFLTPNGYIITNEHVVANATRVVVILYDDTELEAEVMGEDAYSDIAVLRVEGRDFAALAIGTSYSLSVGDTVYAIGNPLGELPNTFTDGMVSALNRDVNVEGMPMTLLQTNTAISPGNSGGPLLNNLAEVVGVVNAKSIRDGVEGLGFAIPIDDAMPIVYDLIENGRVTIRAHLNIIAGTQTEPVGALVHEVVHGGAAYYAGILVDDLIVGIDDQAITSSEGLVRILRRRRVGETATLHILRGEQQLELMVTFGPAL